MTKKKPLKFLCLSTRQEFTTSDYTIKTRNGSKLAVTNCPIKKNEHNKHEAFRFVKKDFKP